MRTGSDSKCHRSSFLQAYRICGYRWRRTCCSPHGRSSDRPFFMARGRCRLAKGLSQVVPTLPMGAHKIPVRCDFALSPHSVAMLLGEFLERMNLEGITLVENDTGRAQTLASEQPDRIERLVIASCEAFDNYPPGLPGRSVALFAKIPGGLAMLALQMRLRFIRRLPLAFGWMAKRPIPR